MILEQTDGKISAALLLAACGTSEEAKVENPESEAQGEQISTEVATASEAEEEVILESPYKEIKEHFENYELPDVGKVDGRLVSYENGYTFDKETKFMIGREWNEDETVNEPTEDQKTGVIMGFLVDAAELGDFEDMTVTNYNEQMSHPISRLNQISELTDFEPLKEWSQETASLLDEAQNLDSGDERQALLKEGYNELQKMKDLINERGEN